MLTVSVFVFYFFDTCIIIYYLRKNVNYKSVAFFIIANVKFFCNIFLKNFKDLWAYPCFILIIMYFYTKIHYIYVIRRFFHIVS